MTDRVSKTVRSAIMASVPTKDTTAELTVRRLLHGLGYRYRLHRRGLPGTPDLVFPARQKAILVHGCFWHGHDCRYGRLPKSRETYWGPKIEANRARDARNLRDLRVLGWRVAVVWQCQLRELPRLRLRLVRFLGPK
jgi:DNA mismatch endonuclease (patch repair protein)